jgi:hypothetical protein
MDSARLRGGEVLGALGGIVAVASLFALDWFARRGGGKVSGWDALVSLRWVLVGAAAVTLLAALCTAWSRTPALPMAAGVAAAGIGLLATALVAYRVLISTPGAAQAGAYLGLAGTLALAVGGLWAIRDERPRHPTQVAIERRPAPPRETGPAPTTGSETPPGGGLGRGGGSSPAESA